MAGSSRITTGLTPRLLQDKPTDIKASVSKSRSKLVENPEGLAKHSSLSFHVQCGNCGKVLSASNMIEHMSSHINNNK